MIEAKCIQKFRNNSGKIYGYRLVDINVDTLDETLIEFKKYFDNYNYTQN